MKARRFLGVALLAIASPLVGQTTGSIAGWVRDGEGRPLPAALVTARSPSLQGERAATTGADGRFHMPGLPPGDYEVRAALEGFHTAGQPGVLLSIDREITLEFSLTRSFSQEVTVLGAPPILDMTGTAIGAIVEREAFERLPTGRSYSSLALLAPGVVDGYYLGSPSINGASAAENRYIVDGLDTTDPGFGTLESTLPPEFLETVEIKTGGFGLEYGGALGGVLNVLTRSGGNDFHASAFGYYKNDGFGADPPESVQNDQFLGSRTYEYGATLGGGILRDRLWYFLGVNPRSEESNLITSQGLRVTDEFKGLSYVGKLSWQPHPSHQLVASAFGDPRESTGTNTFAAGLLRDTLDFQSGHFAFSYSAIFGSSFSAELSAGRYEQTLTRSPVADVPVYIDRAGGAFGRAQNCGDPELVFNGMSFAPGCLGGSFVYEPLDSRRDELRGVGTWYGQTGCVGHQLKAGAVARWIDFNFVTHHPDPAPGAFYDSAGTLVDAGGLAGQQWVLLPTFAQLIELDWNLPGENQELALFLQDQVSVGSRWTIYLGLRADSFDSTGMKTEQDAGARFKFGLNEMIAPRLGLAWDPIGKGRAKLFANFERYYESVPLWLNARAFGSRVRNFYNFEYPANGELPSAENPGVLISSRLTGSGFGIASDLQPQHTDEYLLGFEYQLGQDVSLGLTAVYREVGDVLEDFSIDGSIPFIIGNPGGTITRHPVTGVFLEEPVTIPEPKREYRALQLTFQKRLRDNWQLAGSYVYSKNEGNYVGLYKQDSGQLAPNLTADFDLPELADNASGPLPNDRSHQVKLYGSYQWSFGLITGLFAQYLSGTPISKIGFHEFYGPFRFITPRGSAGRTPDLFTLDLHGEYAIHLVKGQLTIALFADLFNVTDNQDPTVVDQTWTFAGARTTEDPNECGGPGTGPGTACPSGNPNWGGPILFHPPRTLRVGTRLSW